MARALAFLTEAPAKIRSEKQPIIDRHGLLRFSIKNCDDLAKHVLPVVNHEISFGATRHRLARRLIKLREQYANNFSQCQVRRDSERDSLASNILMLHIDPGFRDQRKA